MGKTGQKNPRVMVSWIGYADIQGMVRNFPEDERLKLLRIAGIRPTPKAEFDGPVATFLKCVPCHQLFLLSNYPDEISNLFIIS